MIKPAEELKMERLVVHTKEKLKRHEAALATYEIQVDQLSKQLKGYQPELIQLKSVNSAASSEETDLEKFLRQDIELSDNDSKKNCISHQVQYSTQQVQYQRLHNSKNKGMDKEKKVGGRSQLKLQYVLFHSLNNLVKLVSVVFSILPILILFLFS